MSTEKFLGEKTALVTGGSRGIGKAIAEALAEAGAAVAICGRDAAQVQASVNDIKRLGRATGIDADVSRPEDVSRLFEFVDRELGGLDILVNNAGVGVFKSTADLSVEDWKRTIETNLNGVFYCCREAMPRFRARKGGYVINISSLAGRNPFAGGAAYNASKFGLNGFSEAMMLDHRQEDVRVSYVMPGSVDTAFGSQAAGAGWKIAPEDIAAIVLMLLRMPARTLVSRVEVRPSKPSK
jgi:NAD(P)-dependent dehydrogenase (short-subunit alcohol dehydrogenase family)